MGFVQDITRGVYVMAPPDARTRQAAIDCELRRDELPAGLAYEVEIAVKDASRQLGIDRPRIRWLPKGTPGLRGCVFPERLDEIWVTVQEPRAARETALHETKHIEQLRGGRYIEMKLFTMEQRQQDADAFAATWKPMAFKTGGRLEVKASSSSGWEVSGYASTFSAPDAPASEADAYGDLVMAGAFSESIATRETKLLHEHHEPIGRQLELREDSHGLWGRWSIADTTQGRDTRELVRAGVIGALSIGYVPDVVEQRSDDVRLIRSCTLYEVSCVALAANERAVITGVKSAPARIDITRELARRRLASRRYAGVRMPYGGTR